jgi:DHA1 family inner membrane transport protein
MTTTSQNPLLLVLLLWCAGLGAAAQFSKMSLIFTQLELVYGGGQSSAFLGFLVSLISFLGIVFGLYAGLVVARAGFRRILIAGLILGALVSAFQATVPTLGLMLTSRLIEGASHLVIVVAAPTLIAQTASQHLLPLAMTLWSTFFGVAYAVTAWLGQPLVDVYGMTSLFWVHAGWMLLIAGLVFVALPKDTATTSGPIGNIITRHFEIYSGPATAAPALAWLCYTLTFVSLLTVLPPFLAVENRALVVGLMPLAGIATSLTLGVLLQRLVSAVTVVVIGFAFAAACILGLLHSPGDPILCVTLFGVLGLVQGANFGAIPALNPSDQARAHANGAVAQMGNLGNTFGTPIALSMIALLGFNGLVIFTLMAYGTGIAVHLKLARIRARTA